MSRTVNFGTAALLSKKNCEGRSRYDIRILVLFKSTKFTGAGKGIARIFFFKKKRDLNLLTRHHRYQYSTAAKYVGQTGKAVAGG